MDRLDCEKAYLFGAVLTFPGSGDSLEEEHITLPVAVQCLKRTKSMAMWSSAQVTV